MYRLISQNVDQLLETIKSDRCRVIDPYVELVRRSRAPANFQDVDFRSLYRRYWAMNNAGLTDEFFEAYFKRMEALARDNADLNPGKIACDLYEIPRRQGGGSLQFSFATKLVHTIDRTRPVYDSVIVAFYFIDEGGAGRNMEARLKKRMDSYDYLMREHIRVLDQGFLKEPIDKFRACFDDVASEFTDQKIVDSLIWKFVPWMRSRSFSERMCYQ